MSGASVLRTPRVVGQGCSGTKGLGGVTRWAGLSAPPRRRVQDLLGEIPQPLVDCYGPASSGRHGTAYRPYEGSASRVRRAVPSPATSRSSMAGMKDGTAREGGIVVATGTVKWFSSQKGYGFISQENAPMCSCTTMRSRARGTRA